MTSVKSIGITSPYKLLQRDIQDEASLKLSAVLEVSSKHPYNSGRITLLASSLASSLLWRGLQLRLSLSAVSGVSLSSLQPSPQPPSL